MAHHLQPKEQNILATLVHAEKPMSISEIVATNKSYTTNIVQPIIRKFCDLGLVEVADIVYNKKALTRTFRPTASAQTILQEMFLKEYHSFRRLFSRNSLLTAILQDDLESNPDSDEIECLEQILQSYKKQENIQ